MLSKSSAAEAQWPPRSPREVLLSTPGGRARLQRLEASRTSPSPLRTRRAGSHGLDAENMGGGEGDQDDEDDEETLQLQLQEIQAKLRLKKLQAAKAQKSSSGASGQAASTPGSARAGAGSSAATFHHPRSPQRSTVEVPASPVHRAQSAADLAIQKSPKRVLLGIDKGLRGQDVSLRRAPASFRRGLTNSASSSSVLDGARGGGSAASSARETAPKPLSFNERLAAARTQEAARLEKAEKIQKLRTSAFALGKDEMDHFKSNAVDIPVVEEGPQRYSRDDVLGAASGRKPVTTERGGNGGGTLLRRSNTTPDIRSQYGDENVAPADASASTSAAAQASFEPYSGFHLTRRILPHSVVTRSVTDKTTYAIQDLLRLVKAPNFQLPEVETDVVVLAIVAEKSDPRSHKPVGSGKGSNQGNDKDRGKYMVLTLVDLTYQIELFLFKTGFERFWKISPGTVIAILNPGIMPPPPGRHDTGRWSLVINSDDDTILEIGIARDLGYCKSIKRDGHKCSSWVNSKRTEYCEFHTNEAAKKMRATRNEINGAAGFGSDRDKGSSGRGRGGGRGGRGKGGRGGGNEHSNSGYDYFSQSQWYAAGQSASASSLIDNEALNGGYSDKVERQEGIKRRLAAKERESDIARKLGELGSGAGREYMKMTAQEKQRQKEEAASAARLKKSGTSKSTTGSSSSSSAAAGSSQPLASSSATTAPLSAADQVAASRASLLASIASRRTAASASNLGAQRSGGGLNISNNTPRLDEQTATKTGAPVVHLGPAKRKRPQSSLSSSTTTGNDIGSVSSAGGGAAGSSRGGFGWGSNLQAKLGRMKEGEKLANNLTIENSFKQAAAANSSLTHSATAPVLVPPRAGERSPVRKKTRFLLGDKGIREAGRESLGTTGLGISGADDDDEDELVII